MLTCDKCKTDPKGDGLVEVDGLWLCFDCLPPERINRYPSWRQKHDDFRKRQEQAKKNFNHSGTNGS